MSLNKILLFLNNAYLSFKRLLNIKIKIYENRKNKLNLGCGLAVHKNYINLDSSPHCFISNNPDFIKKIFFRFSGARQYYNEDKYITILRNHTFFHCDVTKSIPVKNLCIDSIYTSHLIEHLELDNAKKLINECFRALKVNGIIRISVPDLDKASSLLTNNNNYDILKKFFYTFENNNEFSRHRFMYNLASLKEILENSGFREVIRCEFKKGNLDEAMDLDNREDESLFIEAIK